MADIVAELNETERAIAGAKREEEDLRDKLTSKENELIRLEVQERDIDSDISRNEALQTELGCT